MFSKSIFWGHTLKHAFFSIEVLGCSFILGFGWGLKSGYFIEFYFEVGKKFIRFNTTCDTGDSKKP